MTQYEEWEAVSQRFGVDMEQVRRDHLISFVLGAISADIPTDDIVFFGGTALSRTYCTDARLSEDIDLIALAPRTDLAAQIEDAVRRGLARSHGRPTWRPALRETVASQPATLAAVANVRAGYVYVISNIGSMGERIVKIGMTRRLDPMDRIRELSDASVPFNFDVHALFFSKDAYGVEAMLHRTFADQRVNRINLRREFFYATPAQVLEVLRQQKVAIVEYRTDAAADEYRASQEIAASRSGKGSAGSSLPNVPLRT